MILTKNTKPENILPNHTITVEIRGILKGKIIFKYLLNKKFKEDSIQSPNLRWEIEYKNTVKKASKIVKISYTFGMKDNLDCNKIESFDINGKSNKTVLQDSSQNFQCVIEGNTICEQSSKLCSTFKSFNHFFIF